MLDWLDDRVKLTKDDVLKSGSWTGSTLSGCVRSRRCSALGYFRYDLGMDYEIKEAQRKHGWKMNECEIEEEYDEDEDGNEIRVKRCYHCGSVPDDCCTRSRKEGETDKDAIEAIQDKLFRHALKKHMGQIEAGIRNENGELVGDGNADNRNGDADNNGAENDCVIS